MSVALPQKTKKFLEVKAGETMVLPKGAKIVSVGIRGDATVTSNCPEVQAALDDAETFKCYSFAVGCDNDASAHVMDEGGALIKKLIIAGQTYEFNSGIVIDALNNEAYGINAISSKVPKILMEAYQISFNSFDKRQEFAIKVRMLPSVAESAEMYLVGTGFEYGLFVKPEEITCPVVED